MIKKQGKIIVVLLLFAVVLFSAYFFVLRPFLSIETEEKSRYDKDGDFLNASGRPFVFPEIAKDDLLSISVTNPKGSYTLLRDSITGEFVFDGAEMLLYDQTKISALYIQSCYMLAIEKIDDARDDLSLYGLSESDFPSEIKVETKQGKTERVLIGNRLVTGGAYYAKHVDKPYIYAISSDLENTILSDIETYLLPRLVPSLTQNEYPYIDGFRIYKDRELFIQTAVLPENERFSDGSSNMHKMLYPAPYIPSNDKLLYIYEKFMDFSGTKVIEYNLSKKDNYQELLEKYKFDLPSYEIKYIYNGHEYYILIGDSIKDKSEYYAYSPSSDLVVSIPYEKVDFLKWDLIEYADRNLFQRNINDIAEISIETPEFKYSFTLEGKADMLQVKQGNDIVDTKNFRQLYILLLNIKMQDYAEFSSESLPLLMTFYVKTDMGEEIEYKFYSLSTRRCYYTINGEGEFYVSRDDIDKIAQNTIKMLDGETISAGLV